MKTLIFLPYFGKRPAYFNLWLHSCGYQQDFDWLILTDHPLPCSPPDNVKVIQCTLSELKQHFQKKTNLPLSLEKPYKLCDYKPFYGYFLSEHLDGYDYWGYCDCDLIFGNIRKYLTRQIQTGYDKCIRTGHFSVIRNSMAVNNVFMKYETRKIVLTSPVVYGYDETVNGYHPGFTGELIREGFTFTDLEEVIADIDFRHFPFYEIHRFGGPFIYLYERGKLYRICYEKGTPVKEECMYIHLQKRHMHVEPGIDPEHFIICPNRFVRYPEAFQKHDCLLIGETLWTQSNQEKFGYFNRPKEKLLNVYRDFRRLLYEPNKIDSLLYRNKKGNDQK